MGERTGIAWTEATWNPVTGCSRVSEGCRFCYAERLSLRYGWSKVPWTHPNASRNVVLHPDRLLRPFKWKAPKMVFVNSMSDLFHEAIPPHFLGQVWATIRCTPFLTYQILTKRPERIAASLPSDWGTTGYRNVWLGVSGETVELATRRVAYLRDVPARVRFLSAEPWLDDCTDASRIDFVLRAVDWVIVGGESGPWARPMNMDSARAVLASAERLKVPRFLKQLGGTPDPRSHEKAVLNGRTYVEVPVVA